MAAQKCGSRGYVCIYKHAAYDCVHFLLGSVQSNHNTTTSGRKTKIAHGRAHVHVQVIAKFENQAQNERELGALKANVRRMCF